MSSETATFENLVGEHAMTIEKSKLARVKDDTLLYAAIDRGSTLTKVLYSSASEDPNSVNLHFALFRNKHFDSALRFLKEKLTAAEVEAGRKLHVTGVGANRFGERIKQELGVDTEFVDEAFCQFAGFHFLLKNFPTETICHPEARFDESILSGIQRGETFERLIEAQVEEMKQRPNGDKNFPCLFAIYGSSAGAVLINEDGSIVVKHRHLLAGKSFLGICQILLGTSDYAEIMKMAAVGKRGNIDTQVRDILADAPDSPYGRMPGTMPFFTFGKAVDFDKSLEDTRREDIAQSLVSAFTLNFVNCVGFVANHDKVRTIYFGGNFFQHEFTRREAMINLKLFGMAELIDIKFLKNGHTAALGAMLSSTKDAKDFFEDMKIKG